jgi:cyclophilin family peptidyl-prolyl cis-trans isomerase
MHASLFARLAVAVGGLVLAACACAANPQVEIQTSKGRIVIELFPDEAPASVANFMQYAKDKHYDGTIFHRVIDGFMIQGGGFTEKMEQKPTREPIINEATNGLRNEVGTVAMARRGQPHSATSQFFINLRDNRALDHRGQDAYGYAVFGKVSQGMDVVQAIAKVPTGTFGIQQSYKNVPVQPVMIQSMKIMPPRRTAAKQ